MNKPSITFVVILICFALNSSAQGYLDYHKKVATAEELIVKGEYETPIKIYDTLFSTYDFCFPKDCYVAAQIAAYSNDEESCFKFLMNGFENGLATNSIQLNPHLKKWSPTSTGKRMNSKTLDSLEIVYQSRINKEARDKMADLFSADQNKIKEEGTIYYNGYDLKPTLKPFWDSLFTELKEIIQLYGYPGEKIAGTPLPAKNSVSLYNATAFYILVHYGKIDEHFENLLLKQINLGNISPEIYGSIIDACDGLHSYEQTKFFATMTCNGLPKSRDKCRTTVMNKMEKINKDRMNIGLPSYECQEKKEQSRVRYKQLAQRQEFIEKPFFDFGMIHFQENNFLR